MIELRMVDEPFDGVVPDWWHAAAGEMWPCKIAEHEIEGRSRCHVVRLPGDGWVWHTNGRSTDAGTLWTVSGTVPRITVTPSINIGPEIWHGWITDGHLSPDVDHDGKP